ncbi:zinc finger protein 132 isoform X5 [Hydra vulgaris]|uniref:Zinc finger protein 132 isoform X5 n=2 Tax=Hydra vulgaris TaxID=6087 RepID=A0ABM4CJE6_HYDVU
MIISFTFAMEFTASKSVDVQDKELNTVQNTQHWKEELLGLRNHIQEVEGRCKLLFTENEHLEAMVHKYQTEYDIDTSFLRTQIQNERSRHVQWKDLYFKMRAELVDLKKKIRVKKDMSNVEFMWMHPSHQLKAECKGCNEERERTSSQSGMQLSEREQTLSQSGIQLSEKDGSLTRPPSASQVFLMESLKDAIVDTSHICNRTTTPSDFKDPSRSSIIHFSKVHKPNELKMESRIKSTFAHSQKPYLQKSFNSEYGGNLSQETPNLPFKPLPDCFKCYICGIYSDSEQQLHYHMEQHNERTFPLSMNIVENENQESFTCSECMKELQNEDDYKNHLLVHMFKCKICSQTFDNDVTFLNHVKTHGEPVDTPYICFICGKQFSHVANLSNHLLYHPDEKSYACEECSKKYSKKSHLTRHMSVHNKCRPYLCLVCGKGFAYRTHLRRHEIVHSEARPHQCSVCQQSFSRKSSLSRHYFIHTTEKPFVCPVCQKGFNRKGRLRNHIKIHIRKGHTQLNDYVIERRPISKEFIESVNNIDNLKPSVESPNLYPGVIQSKATISYQPESLNLKEISKDGIVDSSSSDTENDRESELSEEMAFPGPSKNDTESVKLS